MVFTVQLTIQGEIVNSQCFDFPKMKKDAESGYKIVDEMI